MPTAPARERGQEKERPAGQRVLMDPPAAQNAAVASLCRLPGCILKIASHARSQAFRWIAPLLALASLSCSATCCRPAMARRVHRCIGRPRARRNGLYAAVYVLVPSACCRRGSDDRCGGCSSVFSWRCGGLRARPPALRRRSSSPGTFARDRVSRAAETRSSVPWNRSIDIRAGNIVRCCGFDRRPLLF